MRGRKTNNAREREREWGEERKGKRKIGLNWSPCLLMAVERREREREKNGRLSTTMAGCFWWEWKNLSFSFSLLPHDTKFFPFPSFFGPCADAFMLQQSRRGERNIFNLSLRAWKICQGTSVPPTLKSGRKERKKESFFAPLPTLLFSSSLPPPFQFSLRKILSSLAH